MADAKTIQALADQLWTAEQTRNPIPPLTASYPDLTIADAYAVQLHNRHRRLQAGARIIGKKVGLTAKAMQDLLGVHEPDYGHLFADMLVPPGEPVPAGELLFPRAEAEIAFILGRPLKGPGISVADVLAATHGVAPALEIVDSRIADWQIKIQDTIADNGSSARVVLGGQITPVQGIDLRLIGMVLVHNGQIASTGAGAAALGHPAQAVAWLANKLAEFDIGLDAGEIILPGALTAAVTVRAGDTVTAHFDRLGAVTAAFAA